MTDPGDDVLAGVRVLDRTSGIAGPYCTKILADAGADVVKVEPAEGDPARRAGSGALFEYLDAGKQSVTSVGSLASEADVVLSDDTRWAEGLREADEGLVVTTITPFGRRGPWVGRPWSEFTLQAACGSTGQRGVPEGQPIAAGGRVGEWVAGTYAAVATMAALHGAFCTGSGRTSTSPSSTAWRCRWSPIPHSLHPSQGGHRCRGPAAPSRCPPSNPPATAASSSPPTARSSSRISWS